MKHLIASAFLLILLAAAPHPAVNSHFRQSARSFRQYFRALGPAAASLNPVERLVYSFLLANTTPEAESRT